ncbi:MAG TPA: 4Fe-4S binding protein, partial [Spirochaetota bacterium]|nr:4Fe-4S binding protein [Spirochaetota bacterium]
DTHCFYQISSSLCALIKPLLFVSQGIYNIPIKYFILFTSIIALSLLGKNLFCGWVCPVGAIQETVHFVSPGIKKRRISFTVSNAVRAVIFLSSIILLFTTGINLYYDYLNPFIAASLKLSIMSWFLTSFFFLLAVIAASLFYYRPYCYLICPIGLITWVSTFFSLYRISCDQTRCTRCMKCVEETACPAVKPIIEGKTVLPDCFDCGQCIDKCPENALSFTVK